ncbi:MAG: hypothetical protein IJ449_00945 [Clostridia bacterium]|nr:hypothetical protein [Clostridia bacterium]
MVGTPWYLFFIDSRDLGFLTQVMAWKEESDPLQLWFDGLKLLQDFLQMFGSSDWQARSGFSPHTAALPGAGCRREPAKEKIR